VPVGAVRYKWIVLTRLANGDVEISIRPPLVYLDHWAIREISSAPARREHFLETFRTRGTLMFSVPNMLEMAQNSGVSYTHIRDLLDSVEPYWILSDPDPQTVQDRENRGLLPPESFLLALDVFAVIFSSLPEGTLRLGSALDRLQGDAFRTRAKLMLRPSGVVRLVRQARKRHQNGESMSPSQFPEGTPMWIQDSLLRFLVVDNKKIVENDVIDMLHAVVPLRYAVVVLLDKAWLNFARKLELPWTQLFARPQLDEALEAIRTVDIARHRIIRPDVPRIIRPPV
jgi:hypothetical protein